MPEDASKYPLKAYGVWAGNPKGSPYYPQYCAQEVSDSQGWGYHQCSRNAGHGDRGLFCKAHSREKPKDMLWVLTNNSDGLKVRQIPAEERKKTWKVDHQVLKKTESGIMTSGLGTYYGTDKDALLASMCGRLKNSADHATEVLNRFLEEEEALRRGTQ